MLLSDTDIEIEQARLDLIQPFDSRQVQPASYDLKLGTDFREQRLFDLAIPPRTIIPWEHQPDLYTEPIQPDVYDLAPGAFLLATTHEYVRIPDFLAGQVGGKSSLARHGLIVHATAGFIDPGFEGNITLEMANHGRLPIRLRPGMMIAQLTFMRLETPCVTPYHGKYQGQVGTTASRYWQNYSQ